jgi:hypothetical protein
MPEKQQILIEVPATVSPKAIRRREIVAEFKRIHGIRTHYAPHMERPIRWVAVKVPPKRLDDGGPLGDMDLPTMFANFGRLLDEGGLVGYGSTEFYAIQECCLNQKIKFTP